MPKFDPRALPFLNRDMLDFGTEVTFSLSVDIYANTDATVFITGMTRSGFFSQQIVPTDDMARNELSFQLNDAPISIAANTEGADGYDRLCFAKISLAINNTIVGVLAQGYIAIGQSISYPGGQNRTPLEGRGVMVATTGANPAANNEAFVQPPTNSVVIPRSFRVTLVADAQAANRHVVLEISNGSVSPFLLPAAAVQTANQTVTYIWGDNVAAQNSAGPLVQTMPLPQGLILNDQCTLITATTNRQSGDDFGAPVLYSELYIDAN